MREKAVRLRLLLFALAFALAACGGGPSYETEYSPAEPEDLPEILEEIPEPAADFVFLPQTIYFAQDMWTARIISVQEESLFLLYHPMDEEISVGVARVQKDGSDFTPLWYGTEHHEEEDDTLSSEVTAVAAAAARPAGGVFIVRHHYGGLISGDDFDVFEVYTLLAIAPDGEVVQEANLSEMLEIPAGIMFEIIRLQSLSDGRILLATLDTLYVLSAELQLEREIPFPALDFIATQDDRLFVSLWDEAEERHLVLPFDLESGRIDEEADSLFFTHLNNTVAGTEHDLYISTAQGVFGFDVDTRQFTMLFDWADLDILIPFRVVPSDRGELFFIEQYWGIRDIEHSVALVRMDKHAPPDAPAQVELIYGALMIDPASRREVVTFNRTNDTYRIRIREYYNQLDGNKACARAAFHADILAGDVLDIVDFNLSSFEPYTYHGLLADLGVLLDLDDELEGEYWAEHVRRLLEIDGRLYAIDTVLIPHTILGISANSEHIEPAWLFVRTVLTEALRAMQEL